MTVNTGYRRLASTLCYDIQSLWDKTAPLERHWGSWAESENLCLKTQGGVALGYDRLHRWCGRHDECCCFSAIIFSG